MTDPKYIGQMLYVASRVHRNLADEIFSQIGLHRGQVPVFLELSLEDGMTQSDLAQKMELTQATLTNMLHRMEAGNLVFRVNDPSDGRISRVYLTDYGKSIVTKALELANKLDGITFANFSLDEMVMMNKFLERIHTNIKSISTS